jgi:two-component system cell cycle response regulator CpdR
VKAQANTSSQQKSKVTGRILIAEDDGDTALTYKAALEKVGYEVIAVDNGEDCAKAYIEEFQKLKISKGEAPTNISTHWNQPFEAVILDYKMPQMNGMEVTKEILAVNPHQRIIFASSYVKETLEHSIKELEQVVELLQKPFPCSQLLETISDKQIYDRLKNYNLNIRVLKNAELTHEQLTEILRLMKIARNEVE